MNVMSFQPTFSYRLSTYYLLFIILILPYYLIAFKQKIVKQIKLHFFALFLCCTITQRLMHMFLEIWKKMNFYRIKYF